MVGFIFGGNTGVTQADLNRQREIAKRLAASRSGAPRNVGEGLTFLGEALAYRIAQGRANRMEDDLQARFEEDMGALFPPIPGVGGSSGDYTAPASAPPSVPDTMRVSGVDPELGFGEVQSPEDVPAPDMTGTPLLGFGATSPTLAGVGGEDPTMKGTPTLAPDAVAPLLVEALRKRKAGPQPGEMPSMWEPGQPRLGDAQLGFDNALNNRMSTRGVPAGGDNAFRAALVQRESSGDPNRVNSEGFTGLYQFGQQRLDDFNRATDANVTTQDLIGNPELQEKVADWHFTDIDKAIDGLGTDLSRNGLRAVAHLGGVEGMRRFVASGGQYNPSDSNGTRLADYYREFSALEDGGSPETVVGRDGPNWDQWATGGAAGRDDSFTGLQPEMQRRVAAFMQAADAELGAGAIKITSAYRSPELQAILYKQSGGSGMVAPPGRSQHNFGAAIDLVGANGELLRDPNSPEAVWVRENAPRFGLSTPIAFHSDGRPFEPWQVELAGHRSGKVEPWQGPEVAPSGPIAWNTPQERDTAFLSRISAGDVPDFVNSTFPVEIASGLPEGVQRIVFDVGATPIAVNGENGPMLLPASAKLGAQAAAALGGALPTRRIVEEMYRQQPTRPMPTQTPGPGMTGADAVMQSSAAMFADGATGPIVGTTKEILADGSFMGGDNGRGGMWQPYIDLNVDHNADYADYSHGARVVRGATVYPTNGEPYQVSAAELYSDPQYAEALGLSGPVQAPQPTRVADAGPAMRMSAKDMPQGGGRASDLIPYAMSDGRGAILPEREVFRPTIDKGGATNPQITAPSAPAPGFYEDPTPGRYDPDLVMRLYNAQQQWGNRMSAGQKALVERIIANEAKQQGGWDYDPSIPQPDFTMVNGIPHVWNGQTGALEPVPGVAPSQPEMPSSVREYEYYVQQEEAAGRQPMPFGEWSIAEERAGNPNQRRPELLGTQGLIAIPDDTVPQGYRVEPAPGSPLFLESQANEEAAANKEQTQEQQTNLVLDEIGIAKDLIQGQSVFSPATGMAGKALSLVDETRAGALKNRLETIKANIGFDKLQAMRDASPTGGALGQVSEFENRLLQAVYGSLEQAQSAEDILYNLTRLEDVYTRIINEGIPENEARELYRQVVTRGYQPETEQQEPAAEPPTSATPPDTPSIMSLPRNERTAFLEEHATRLSPEARARLDTMTREQQRAFWENYYKTWVASQ